MATMTTRRPSLWRWLGWLVLLGVLAVAVTSMVTLAFAIEQWPSDLVVSIDGERIDLHAMEAGHWWLALGGVVLAAVVVLVVVPLALIFGLGVPLLLAALALGVGLLIAALAVAAVGSPLILLGLLLWWAVRPRKTQPSAPAAPSPAPAVPVIGQHTDNQTPFA